MFGFVTIYQNNRDGTILVQPCARHPIGAIGEIGDPAVLHEPELASQLVDEVVKGLNAFASTRYDDTLVPAKSKSEQRKFVRSHKSVSVTRTEDGTMEVLPSRHERGGFVSIDNKKQSLGAGVGKAELYNAILQALETAE